METIESKIINDFLAAGTKVPLTETPMFRLVWSDEQFELRTGTFNIRDTDGRFLATVTKTENVLKYNWIKDRWILEQWYPPEVCLNEELPDSKNGSFEPIYVFESKYGNALPLNKLVVEIILQRLGQPARSSAQIKADLKAEMDAVEAYIDKSDLDLLMDEGPLVSQLHDGSAILSPGFPQDKNLVVQG